MLRKNTQSQLQESRSELKFVVPESLVPEISGYLQTRMERDPHSSDAGYDVCSVYLDCPSSRLYSQTIKGQKNRFKLRARIYDNDETQPAFLEIKRREGSVIKKQRAIVDRVSAVEVLSGNHVSSEAASIFDGTVKGLNAFQEFMRLRDQIAAVGTTFVYYKRVAYVSPQGSSWRATFDRQLKTELYQAGDSIRIPESCIDTPETDTVVFELKFTDRFPHWMRELVRVFNLEIVSFPKYINCYNTLSTQRRTQPIAPSDQLTTESGTLI